MLIGLLHIAQVSLTKIS